MKLKKTYLLGVGFFLFVEAIVVFAQQPTRCTAGTLTFGCPESFTKASAPDATSSLFKYKNKDTILYFFVSSPSGTFQPEAIMNAVGKEYSAGSKFQWKKSKEVFMMSMETRYESELAAWLGFDGQRLLNFKTASFSVNGKEVVFGYSWEEDDIGSATVARRLFDRGESLGDQAIGCNAVATALNSVTKEFKGGRQYCSLMTAPAATPR